MGVKKEFKSSTGTITFKEGDMLEELCYPEDSPLYRHKSSGGESFQFVDQDQHPEDVKVFEAILNNDKGYCQDHERPSDAVFDDPALKPYVCKKDKCANWVSLEAQPRSYYLEE